MAAKKDTAAYRRKMKCRAKNTGVAKEPLMNEKQANLRSQRDKAYAELKVISNAVEHFKKVLAASKEHVLDLENQLTLAKMELMEYEALLDCSNRRLFIRKQALSQELYKNEGIGFNSPASLA